MRGRIHLSGACWEQCRAGGDRGATVETVEGNSPSGWGWGGAVGLSLAWGHTGGPGLLAVELGESPAGRRPQGLSPGLGLL